MPQARSIYGATEHAPNGPGSLYSNLVEVSLSMRRRALKFNDVEKVKLDRRLEQIERNARADRAFRSRIMTRVGRKLQERRALQKVLSERFRVDDFNTMTLPYRCKEALTGENRYSCETKIYHGGFTQKTLQPEIARQLEEWDPMNMQRKQRETKIKELKKKNEVYVVDRSRSLTAILKDHKQHVVQRAGVPAHKTKVKVKDKYDIFADLDNESLDSDEDSDTDKVTGAGTLKQTTVLPGLRERNNGTKKKGDTHITTNSKNKPGVFALPGIGKNTLPPIGNDPREGVDGSGGLAEGQAPQSFGSFQTNKGDQQRDPLITRLSDDQFSDVPADSFRLSGMPASPPETSRDGGSKPRTIDDVQPLLEAERGAARDRVGAKRPLVMLAKPLHRQASNAALVVQTIDEL